MEKSVKLTSNICSTSQKGHELIATAGSWVSAVWWVRGCVSHASEAQSSMLGPSRRLLCAVAPFWRFPSLRSLSVVPNKVSATNKTRRFTRLSNNWLPLFLYTRCNGRRILCLVSASNGMLLLLLLLLALSAHVRAEDRSIRQRIVGLPISTTHALGAWLRQTGRRKKMCLFVI